MNGASSSRPRRLPSAFYRRADVVAISRELLGKFLFTRLGGRAVTGGMIVETEAYAGAADRACHAFGYRRTARNETMFAHGGVAYVYLCYGLHAMLNFVTHTRNEPYAVLIRAIEPFRGVETMRVRRGVLMPARRLTAGPGALTKALGITVKQNGCSLRGPEIWVEDRGVSVSECDIIAAPRVGVDYAGADKDRPWRFYVRDNPCVSKRSRGG